MDEEKHNFFVSLKKKLFRSRLWCFKRR